MAKMAEMAKVLPILPLSPVRFFMCLHRFFYALAVFEAPIRKKNVLFLQYVHSKNVLFFANIHNKSVMRFFAYATARRVFD